MQPLTPIKVRIGKAIDGNAQYPDFKAVMQSLNLKADWSMYVDRFGGWHYDCCGHDEQDMEYDSPVGKQWGMLCVPHQFAEKCIELFPETCFILTEQECEAFYNDRCCRDQPEFHEDLEELQAIVALEQLGEDVTDRKANALDPDNPARGRQRNKRKFWQGYKSQRGIEIDHESISVLSERRRENLQARGDGDAADASEPTGT